MQGPSSTYPFGTDEFGRDMLSRVIYGTRPALRVAFLAMLIEVGIGVTLGLLAGYYGGVTDYIVTFIGDLTWCVPPIVLTMAVIAVIGKGTEALRVYSGGMRYMRKRAYGVPGRTDG